MCLLSWLVKVLAVLLIVVSCALALPAQTTPVSTNPPAMTFTTLFSFDEASGVSPNGLVQATGGDIYGTAQFGGAKNSGTVFQLTSQGALTTIYSFCSQSGCADGAQPLAGLIQGTDGSLYGTTFGGGNNHDCEGDTCGTVFKVAPDGALTSLHSFDWADGFEPYAGVIRGIDGSFYGTTPSGGYLGKGIGNGTIFQMSPSGSLTTLYDFCAVTGFYCANGTYPRAGLVQATDGSFYGTTEYGGNYDSCSDGCGTIFRITPSGELTTLHNFHETDGTSPIGVLVQGDDGKLYGTTAGGGADSNCAGGGGCGTVFSMTRDGKLTTLHSFDGTDGANPWAGLVLGSDGNFYGTTSSAGGSNVVCRGDPPGCGTIFRITPDGTLLTLHNFCLQSGCTDGGVPASGLIQGTDGRFYGTAGYGANGDGTIFSLDVGLEPFVETNPAAGKAGATIGILGTDLTGATSVKFNGTQTAFRVVSKTFIEAKVPSGATTGKVQVQLPSGTLSSNVPFYVLP
jgi:uncharacterized repeat protein (TIGR03803 family)